MYSVYNSSVLKPITHYCIKKFTKSISAGVQAESTHIPPLKGIRILDLTRIIAGPFCTMLLGDLGAEVIKVERPGRGDEARKWGPPFINGSSEACYFISVNRNKKSICLDLKSESGCSILYDLAKKSDVLIENYVPGKLEELKLGYNQVHPIAPHLIYCSITGYGSKGPYRNRPGFDVIAASVGGLLHVTGQENGEPVKVGVPITDICTGLYAHGAIMAALIKRSITGLGQKIDCNLFSTQISTLINIGSNYLNANKEGKRWGTAHESIVPYESFPTKDGYFTVGVGSDEHFVDFCNRIGQPHLSTNPKFLTNIKRVENRKELIDHLRVVFRSKTNSEWYKIFSGSKCPYGPINSMKEVFDHPQTKALNLVRELQHPTIGSMKVVGPAVEYSQGGNKIRIPPPALGEHTNEVLKEILGYNDEKIKQLKADNVVE